MNAMPWMKRGAIALGTVAGLAVFTGAVYERIARQRATRDFPAPGRLVDIGGGRRLQLDCRGAGSPTVVLESGLDNYGSLAWAAVQDSIATTTRVCAYSRSGIMWSDPTDGPFDVTARARDLHAALVASGESAPWIMVGHSLGGPFVMIYTKMYDSEVAGVVFVDPTHPDQFTRFREVAGKPMQPSAREVLLGARLAWTGLLRMLPNEAEADRPTIVNRMTAAFLPTSLAELGRETEAIPAILHAAGAMRSFGDRPLVVLTSTREHSAATLGAMGVTRDQAARLQAASRALNEEAAHWSSRGEHELVERASHYIQFDRPDAVTAAIRRVVSATRLGMIFPQ
jgi:pimeloyl-ACP methyl ester carboxylesterase